MIELETKFHAYTNGTNLVNELIDNHIVGSKIGIGFDYD